jgi:hypothetical protein
MTSESQKAYEVMLFIKQCKKESKTNFPTESQKTEFLKRFPSLPFGEKPEGWVNVFEQLWPDIAPVYK